MGLRISIDLDDEDLKHFRLIMREARHSALRLSPEDVVANAEQLLQKIDKQIVPTFVRERLRKLEFMIHMLVDHEWRLPQKDTTRVLNALAYFAEPEDLIPDQIPGIGYLDDAIMVELIVKELRHDIEGYADFCEAEGPLKKSKRGTPEDQERLQVRRQRLQRRIRRRNRSGRSGGASRGARLSLW